MIEKTDSSSVFETPNSSLYYDNQQDEDPVSHLIQRISKLEAIISKLLKLTLRVWKSQISNVRYPIYQLEC